VIPTLILVVPRVGVDGAAAVWATLNLGYFLVVAPLTFRRLMPDDLAAWYLRDTVIPFVTGFFACLIVRAAEPLLEAYKIYDLVLVLIGGSVTIGALIASAPLAKNWMIAAIRSVGTWKHV
jgi:hypothetical protein